MILSLIVARSTNGVIGTNGNLPWHLSADLKRFRLLTTGHWILMGRKTWESIGRPLPERTSVVITRNSDYQCEGALVAHNFLEAIRRASNQHEVFVIGGASIYAEALPLADRLHVTQVHTEVEGNVYFPEVDLTQWELLHQTNHKADKKNPYDYSFLHYERIEQ